MRLLGFVAFFVMISTISMADDFFNPPPLNPELPPWMQESNSAPAQPQSPPGQGVPETSPPPMAEPMPFDGESSGEDDGGASPFDFDGGSSGGGGGRAADQGKTNFQVLDEVQRGKSGPDCVGWGSAFLGTKIYVSETMCRNELDQQLEVARDKITNYTDHTEKEVLRGVIKGKVPREKSKDFHLDFTELKNSLTTAAKSGCRCLE